MFNDRSTHAERQAVLQRLMTHPGAGSSPGSGVHAAKDVNRMLARSEAEFDLFQQVSFFPYLLSPGATGSLLELMH